MINSIFGNALGGLLGSTASQSNQANQLGLQNGYNQQMSNAIAQQQMAQYNRYAQQRLAKWMINGEVFMSSKDFALHIWPDDESARLMFALKYPD